MVSGNKAMQKHFRSAARENEIKRKKSAALENWKRDAITATKAAKRPL